MPNDVTTDRDTGLSDRELVVTRIFDAPRELVFEAFTDPRHLMKWWGPHGCTVVACEADPRPGGIWSISMRSPRLLPHFSSRYPARSVSSERPQQRRTEDRPASPEHDWIVEKQRGVYRDVIKPERLVFTYSFEDEAGRPLHQTTVTISLAEEGGKTRLTLHQSAFESVSARDDHVRGWGEALEHLTDHLMHTA